MDITAAKYFQVDGVNDSVHATIDGEDLIVPIDTDNRHYAFMKAKHDDPNDSFTIADAD